MGERGAYVAALQFFLDCAGHGPVSVDGVFGEETAGAVATAQAAEGKVATGEPDEETFATLARSCDERRIITLEAGDPRIEVAGNVASGDDDLFDLTVLEGRTLVVDVMMLEPVNVSIEGSDGTILQSPGAGNFSVEIPTTQVYAIRVSGTGSASYLMTIEIPALAPSEPFDPEDWIGLEYTGQLPEGLELLNGQCVGVDDVCDYGVTIAVRRGALGLTGGSGTIDYLGLLEINLGEAWRIVDAKTVRVEGERIITATCFTTADDAPAVGISDYPKALLHAFVWDVAEENLTVVPGEEVTCLDPADNE
jgi:peptidoglycan hydrolase-like protein with peptidoglycan-binding domain